MAISKINSKALVDCSVAAVDIEDGSITNAKLAGSIANAKLANSSITVNGSSVSLGASGSIPPVQWQSVVTADGSTTTTAVSGNGYFIDTTSAAHTITLPASPSAGDYVAIKDYAGTFGTNNLTIGRNSENIQGVANDSLITTNRASVVLVYVDSTKGWLYSNESNVADLEFKTYVTATGGTVTTSGDFKIHTFTGDGCFAVSSIGNCAGGGDEVSYMVVAGGGGGGQVGGAGAGGFREGKASNDSYTASPLNAPTGLTVTATTYPVTVGGGGQGGGGPSPNYGRVPGSPSTFSTITSAGGDEGTGNHNPADNINNGGTGGSGGGGTSADYPFPGGTGNSPPVSPPQGNPGGNASTGDGSNWLGGGGGGATQAGAAGGPNSGAGGDGAQTAISGSATYYAGGAGSGAFARSWSDGGQGGGGQGGGAAPFDRDATSGTANTGGGGGGMGLTGAGTGRPADAGSGGKGIVIIRYKYQN